MGFAMHRRRASLAGVYRCSQPVEVTQVFAVDYRMNVGSLWRDLHHGITARDWLGQHVRWGGPQSVIDVRKMLAVELVKLAIIGGVVLRFIPPVPVTAFSFHQLFFCHTLLLMGRLSCVLIQILLAHLILLPSLIYPPSPPHIYSLPS